MPSRQVQERADSIAEAAAVLVAYAEAAEKIARRMTQMAECPATQARAYQLASWDMRRTREQLTRAVKLLNDKITQQDARLRVDRPDLFARPDVPMLMVPPFPRGGAR